MTVRSKALRGTCPNCGRTIACYADRYALQAGMGLMFNLMPHNTAGHPVAKCKGWRIGKDALEPRDS